MTKKEMIEALDGLDDDAEIRVEIRPRSFCYPYNTAVKDLRATNVYLSEQRIILYGEI